MLRFLVFFSIYAAIAPTAFAQPGGGSPDCKVAVSLNCLVISQLGGRCIDTNSHSCGYDPFSEVWICSPAKGVDMVDATPYWKSVKAGQNQPGQLYWVHVNGAPCGFLEDCFCHDSLTYCDFVHDPPSWGPGHDVLDFGLYGPPPVPSDCFGVGP